MNRLTLNTLRGLGASFGRFAAIMAITAISCAFYSGVKGCSPLLKGAAWKYFEDTSLADVRVVSTLGFSDEDAAEIIKGEPFYTGYGCYSADLFTEGDRGQVTVHVMSYSPAYSLNTPFLTEGRLPSASGELLMDAKQSEDLSLSVGDKVIFTAEDIEDKLAVTEFTVVGKALSPLYTTDNRGVTNVGNGEIAAFAYIPEEDFSFGAFTEIYLGVKGGKTCTPFGDDYDFISQSAVRSIETREEELLESRRESIRNEALDEMSEEVAKLEDAQRELDINRHKYEDSKEELRDSEELLKKQEETVSVAGEEALKTLEALNTSYNDLAELASTCGEIDAWLTAYESVSLTVLPQDMRDSFTRIQTIYDKNNVAANIGEQLSFYVLNDPVTQAEEKAAAKAAVSAVNEQVRSASSSTMAQLSSQIDAINDKMANPGQDYEKLVAAKEEIAEAKKELKKAGRKLKEAQLEIDEGRAEIDKVLDELEEEIKGGRLYVTARKDFNPDCMTYGLDCDRVDSIADVFPVFFVLLSALVCWSAMTRLVEQKRNEAGTLKALGYSDASVIAQYVLYALAASVIGSVAGVLAGFKFLPRIIYECYTTMYNIPGFTDGFDPKLAGICAGCAILCNVVSVLVTSAGELRSSPASLIRPRPPRSGKRILLERIAPLWKRTPFLTKVSLRNLLRYKSRFFVSVLGVCGCTALLLTAFGLRYSISGVLDAQFKGVDRYSGICTLDEEISDEEIEKVISTAKDIPEITDVIPAVRVLHGIPGRKKTVNAYFTAAEDISAIVALTDRDTGKELPCVPPENECYITEKLSILTGIKKGDMITPIEGFGALKVAGVTKNHIEHFVYLSPESYKRVFGSCRTDTLYFSADGLPEKARRSEITSAVISCEGVTSAIFMEDGVSNFYSLFKSLDAIILMIILFVAALTLVILLNLADINISERTRELASIKVLGFYDKELSSYVFRENIISAALGIASGLILGIFLESFVIVTAETDAVMFLRGLAPWCFGAAAAVMVIFVLAADIFIKIRLMGIDMAQSMKAVE